jgi:CoA:oxalate CoA-transferase
MLDCQVAILENALARYQVSHKNPQPLGNRHPTISPFQAFKASDDYMVIAVGNDVLWQNFCTALERPDLTAHEQFSTNKLRTENIAELAKILEVEFGRKTVEEWCELFERHGVPYSPINKIDKVIQHPQVLARNMIVDVHDPEIGTIKIAGNPIKMTSIPEESNRKTAPAIGEHTNEILREYLGLSDDDIKQLSQEGVI